MMVEAEESDNAWDLVKNQGQNAPTEEVVAQGLEAAKPFIRTLVEAQADLAQRAAKETREFPRFLDYEDDVFAAVEPAVTQDLTAALTIADKQERENRLDEIQAAALEQFGEEFSEREKEISAAIRAITKQVIRERILRESVRIDGRGLADIRQLSAEGRSEAHTS